MTIKNKVVQTFPSRQLDPTRAVAATSSAVAARFRCRPGRIAIAQQ